MAEFKSETAPKASVYLEKFLDKNPKDEVFCVENKVSSHRELFYPVD